MGAELWGGSKVRAGPAATPSKPRPSDQPLALPLDGVEGGSEGRPPSRHRPLPRPLPAHVSALPGTSEQQGKEIPRAATEPLDAEKASPHAASPTGPVTSPEAGLRGSAPWPRAFAPTSWSAAPAGLGERGPSVHKLHVTKCCSLYPRAPP